MATIRHLVRKEFRQILRDRAMLRMIFLMPVVQLFVFSYAANLDLENVSVARLDEDRTPASRQLLAAFDQSDVFVAGPAASTPEELAGHLLHEDARVAVWIPADFAVDLAAGRTPPVALTLDGQNSSLAGRAASYAGDLIAREMDRMRAEAAVDGTIGGTNSGGLPPPRIEKITRFFYNPQLESRFFMVPGILVVLITVISALLTGMAVVREKEIGTLEQLLVSPISAPQLIAGKTIPFVIISYFELVFAGTIAVLWFRVPLEGSLFLLAVAALAYLLVTLGMGLLASVVSTTQQQAMFTVWFFLVFSILMSGFFFPVENMPGWAQALTLANPMRWILEIVRGVFLKGAGFADLWPQLATLSVMGVAVFLAAALQFGRRLG
ncbi:MAG: ABC transporter permease [Candidatus Krumholzibacteriia bacterium]